MPRGFIGTWKVLQALPGNFLERPHNWIHVSPRSCQWRRIDGQSVNYEVTKALCLTAVPSHSLGLGKRHLDYRSHNPQGSSFAATQPLHWGSIFSYSPFTFLEEQNGRAWFQDDLRHQSEVKVTRHIQLFATPWVVDRSGSSVQGILQVRILEWVAVPFFRGSSLPRNWTLVSCIAGRFFTIWVT